jgi:hypothetical protein
VTTPEIMSWVIGVANPLSATLTGPLLVVTLGANRASKWQEAGWLVLLVGQTTFLAFGLISDLPGFKYAQPFMIPVAAMNFTLWLMHRRKVKQAAAEVEPGGRHRYSRPQTCPEDPEPVTT